MLPINDKIMYVFFFFLSLFFSLFHSTAQELKGKQKEKRMLGIIFYPHNSSKNKSCLTRNLFVCFHNRAWKLHAY